MAIPQFFSGHTGPWSNGIETLRVAEAMASVAKNGEAPGVEVLVIEALRTGTMLQHSTSPEEGPRFVESSYVQAELGLYRYDKDLPCLVGIRSHDEDTLTRFHQAVTRELNPNAFTPTFE